MHFAFARISETAGRRAQSAIRLLGAGMLAGFSVLACATTYDVTNLSLGGSFVSVAGIDPNGRAFGSSTLAGDAASHAFIASRTRGVVDIGTLGGGYSYAVAGNASGQVVGSSNTANAADGYHTFLWTDSGGMVDICGITGYSCVPRAVSDSGQVIGTFGRSGPDVHAYSWTSTGGIVDIGTLGGTFTVPRAISPSGQIVGDSRIAPAVDVSHAFSWTQAGGIVDLGVLPGGHNSLATAVNRFGQVVGISYLDSGIAHAFLWTAVGGMLDLGTNGQDESRPLAILDSGQVFGYSRSFTPQGQVWRAWTWTQTDGMIDLGSLGGAQTVPFEVSASGQVVGYSQTSDSNHAFSWTVAGGMVDLGTLGGIFSVAKAVNVPGQIAGASYLPGNNASHGFVYDATGLKDLNDLLLNKPTGLELDDVLLLSADGSIVASSNVGNVLLSPSTPAAAAPVVGAISTNDPVAVGTTLSASAGFTDVNTSDTHSAVWVWGDGAAPQSGAVTESSGTGNAKGSHMYSAAGIYTLGLAVTDNGGLTGNVTRNVVVYDPSAGFVTGNGSIYSALGAFKSDPTVAGLATFSFVSKYQKGAKVPVGTTAFQFQAANLDFYSDSYDWMVVAGARAQFKGEGTLDGTAGYQFLLTAIDGQLTGGGGKDRFRIRIWHYDATLQQDIVDYDNQLDASTDGTLSEGTAISSGSIVIHTSSK